ncbi:hypothetical protein H4R34_002259, partial [Dimargaris verticillata]
LFTKTAVAERMKQHEQEAVFPVKATNSSIPVTSSSNRRQTWCCPSTPDAKVSGDTLRPLAHRPRRRWTQRVADYTWRRPLRPRAGSEHRSYMSEKHLLA